MPGAVRWQKPFSIIFRIFSGICPGRVTPQRYTGGRKRLLRNSLRAQRIEHQQMHSRDVAVEPRLDRPSAGRIPTPASVFLRAQFFTRSYALIGIELSPSINSGLKFRHGQLRSLFAWTQLIRTHGLSPAICPGTDAPCGSEIA